MTTVEPTPVVARSRRSGRAVAARSCVWAVRIVLAAQFAMGGALKLAAEPAMVAMFTDIGAGQWLRIAVGACEVAAAAGLLFPRLARLAAAGLVILMIGAAATNVIVLHTSPVVPLVLGALAAFVAVVRVGKEGER